jgi:holo-[acyl-carrier protein] synthase
MGVGVIFGIGTDIIEVARIGEMAARGRQYLETIFTEKEIEYCESKSRKSQHYAVRYAAKEAALKALSIGWRDGLGFCEIEVLDDERGKPQVFVHGKVKALFEQLQIKQTSISLSHSKESAIAVVILET